MEDISRDLEREIARSKPKPYIQNRRERIIIIDDFGGMKSGDYLKILMKLFSFTSVVCLIAAAVLYYLYSDLSRDSDSVRTEFDTAQQKVKELTQEKAVLMAKLVISGQKLDIQPEKVVSNAPGVEKNEAEPALPESKDIEDQKMPVKVEEKEKKTVPESDGSDKIVKTSVSQPRPIPGKIVNKTVTIENFIVKKSRSNKELLVRFDIRKISKKPGDVSGRIFTVLIPENTSEDQWLVVPTTLLKNGIPSEYKKGQYFSIANFKPVRFRIRNQAESDFFKKAAIFIFNEQEDLIFEEMVTIGQE